MKSSLKNTTFQASFSTSYRPQKSKTSSSKKAKGTKHSRDKQSYFSEDVFKINKEFGGCLHGKGHAKLARPLSTKQAMHVVLRSSLAKGDWSLRSVKNMKMVEQTLRKLASKYGIRIYRFANVGNHIHLLIKLSNRFTFAPFIRALSGMIAMRVTGAKKLSALTDKFWDFRPWSRIVEWGKAFRAARTYVFQNELEADGVIPHQPRRQKSKSPPPRTRSA